MEIFASMDWHNWLVLFLILFAIVAVIRALSDFIDIAVSLVIAIIAVMVLTWLIQGATGVNIIVEAMPFLGEAWNWIWGYLASFFPFLDVPQPLA